VGGFIYNILAVLLSIVRLLAAAAYVIKITRLKA
jgi:hypothetical protein